MGTTSSQLCRDWKITEMPPVNAQSLGLVELGFLRVDSINRNQILSEIRSRSGPDRCIWHANRGKSNQGQINQMSCQSINHIMAQFPRMSTHQSIKSMSSTHVTLRYKSKSLFYTILSFRPPSPLSLPKSLSPSRFLLRPPLLHREPPPSATVPRRRRLAPPR